MILNPSPKKESESKDGISLVNIGCLLIIIIVAGFYFIAYFPGYLHYRKEVYCKDAESDAHNVLATLTAYFSDPDHEKIPTIEELQQNYRLMLNNPDVKITGQLPDLCVVIKDASARCPRGDEYVSCFDGIERWQ